MSTLPDGPSRARKATHLTRLTWPFCCTHCAHCTAANWQAFPSHVCASPSIFVNENWLFWFDLNLLCLVAGLTDARRMCTPRATLTQVGAVCARGRRLTFSRQHSTATQSSI